MARTTALTWQLLMRSRNFLDVNHARRYANPRISVTRGVMAANEKTFGGAISEARKAKGWSLKDLASRVLREDEEPISPQYLNDIEHDRRSPSSDRMVQQFADALGMDPDWLYYLAGRFPEDVRGKKLSEKQVAEAMVAFRGGPAKGKGRK
jgi:transcriptional regulator with XRE-family HTH domain